MNNHKVLIVDDEEDMRNLIQMYLENAGFTCFQVSNGNDAYQYIQRSDIDIILLDIMMPEMDGFEVCEGIRKNSNVPIIFLSAKGEEWDKVRGLQLGADDYIVKPFNPGELTARIQAVLRRTGGTSEDESGFRVGKVTIDHKARTVSVDKTLVPLTLKEYEMLLYLVKNKGQAISREQLLEKIWGYDYSGSLRTVDTHIKTLRMKLGTDDYIQTVWGIGYKFEEPK